MKALSKISAARATAAAMLLAAAPAVYAQGWLTAFNNVTALGRAGATAVMVVFFMVGLMAIGYGGKLLWDKGGERGEDIKVGRIVFTFIGGAVMVALGFIALQTVQTMGGSAGDIGATITPN